MCILTFLGSQASVRYCIDDPFSFLKFVFDFGASSGRAILGTLENNKLTKVTIDTCYNF